MEGYYEEINFGKHDKETSPIDLKEDYVIFHYVYGKKNLPFSPGKAIIDVSYDKLVGYLEGATLGKIPQKEIFLYNGVSHSVRNGMWPSTEIWPLEEGELEKLLEDSGLDRKFEKKVRRV